MFPAPLSEIENQLAEVSVLVCTCDTGVEIFHSHKCPIDQHRRKSDPGNERHALQRHSEQDAIEASQSTHMRAGRTLQGTVSKLPTSCTKKKV
jgi:hypothetical protein